MKAIQSFFHDDFPVRVGDPSEGDGCGILGEERSYPLGPLDEDDTRRISGPFLESEPLHLGGVVDAVGVHVIDPGDARGRRLGQVILLHDDESGTGIGAGGAERLEEPLDEGRLACAQIAPEQDGAPGSDAPGEPLAEGAGFVGRVGDDGGHRKRSVINS